MQLFPDEYVITTSNNNSVILTSHRVTYKYSSLSKSQTQTIMLEHITSCEGEKSSNNLNLVLALIGVFIFWGGTNNANEFQIYLGAALGLIMGWKYLSSKKSLILISSPSATIKIAGNGLSKEKINDFINKVEQAKHKRLMSVAKHGH